MRQCGCRCGVGWALVDCNFSTKGRKKNLKGRKDSSEPGLGRI
jgi:hypothetical protein